MGSASIMDLLDHIQEEVNKFQQFRVLIQFEDQLVDVVAIIKAIFKLFVIFFV